MQLHVIVTESDAADIAPAAGRSQCSSKRDARQWKAERNCGVLSLCIAGVRGRLHSSACRIMCLQAGNIMCLLPCHNTCGCGLRRDEEVRHGGNSFQMRWRPA